jgi:CDP-diacylglycerol--serine O-phosphatidyltransferase
MVLPVFVLVVLFFALLISYPWMVLTIGTVIYLASLPLGWMSYRNYERRDAAATQAGAAAQAHAGEHESVPGETQSLSPGPSDQPRERPARLN